MKAPILTFPVLTAVVLVMVTGCASQPASAPAPTTTAASTAAPATALNTWAMPGSVAATALPVGDGHTSTSAAAIGSVFSCQPGNPNLGGSQVDGPWIHGSTWNANEKIAVAGTVSWPTAHFTVTVDGSTRTIITNNLPSGFQTGIFPIAKDDPAYAYDRNPNTINATASVTISLPSTGTAAAAPSCLSGGAIGVLLNGVMLYNALDGPGRDAVAHEEQDLCQGHPQAQGQYHYHEVPTCLRDNATAQSTVVGWANDGFPIVVERDAAGNLPNNADLDECHGRVSPVVIDGVSTSVYHYDATLEYPYTIGCFRGTNAVRSMGAP